MQQREDNEAESEKKESVEKEEQQNKQIRDMGQVILNENSNKYKVELLTIIGEVEGHESAPSHSKTTKYEHVLPKLAMIEDDKSVDGLLVCLILWAVSGSWSCHCRDDRLFKRAHSVPGTWRRSLHWCSHGCICRLFFCSSQCHHGDPPCSHKWHVYWRRPVLPQHGENPGPDHHLHFQSHSHVPGKTGRTNAGHYAAGKRCGNYVRRSGGSERRSNR